MNGFRRTCPAIGTAALAITSSGVYPDMNSTRSSGLRVRRRSAEIGPVDAGQDDIGEQEIEWLRFAGRDRQGIR